MQNLKSLLPDLGLFFVVRNSNDEEEETVRTIRLSTPRTIFYFVFVFLVEIRTVFADVFEIAMLFLFVV